MRSLFEAFAGNNNISVVLSKLGCYLYGDNAIDEWCDKVGVSKGRKRQTNTIEFYNPYDNKSNNKNIEEVLKDEGFTVDASSIEIFGERKDINIAVLTGYEKNSKMYTSIKNLKIMHPAVLFVEKLGDYIMRRNMKETKIDLTVLFEIIQKLGDLDLLKIAIEKRKFTYNEVDDIVSWLDKIGVKGQSIADVFHIPSHVSPIPMRRKF